MTVTWGRQWSCWVSVASLWAALIGLTSVTGTQAADTAWQVGFAKQDVTPTEPVRLSGYATRSESHQGVADPLAARAMVLSPSSDAESREAVVLVSVDSIAITNAMSVEIAKWAASSYGIPRSQIVLASTHSHTAPQLAGALENLYRVESTPQQRAATERYTRRLTESIMQVIEEAWNERQAATIQLGQAQSDIAINRRVLVDGKWSTFGEQTDGPVDRRVRVMKAISTDGRLLGAAFLYACHCTTLGPDFNQISGDWAGIAAQRLENVHSGAIFLPIIGAGADANPNPRGGGYEMALQHGAEMVDAVGRALSDSSQGRPESFPECHFGYAGLAPEQPTSQTLQTMAESEQPNERRWAEHMLRVKQEMGRLPESYPMPIHTWQFGDALAWVFLGGEVVVDYQFLIEKELPSDQTWVAAYTDDVFAYVASERMRSEGGYEVDFSMIYYLQPGRWQTGTQSLITQRVAEIFRQETDEARPLSPQEGLQSLRVPEGFRVELVAAEPYVQDPINVAFGPDGEAWVVEMADYPRGATGGGRVRRLSDSDGDGSYDRSEVFLSDLSFPTSAMPWGDGVLVVAAPDIFWARDTDGDGRADEREVLLSGISEANPQHRASGFEIGLDGWLHFAGGSGTRRLTSHRNGQEYDVHGHDVAWNPNTGEIQSVAGETQFVRSRDAWGIWFGNSNSRPMYQYVVESRYLRGASLAGGVEADLLTPSLAPPVLPRSRTVDRFNDLYAENRFTSACSSIVVGVPGVADQEAPVALICEPVHNLVARIELASSQSHFTARRHPDDQEFDFFTSTDPWSRPVRAVNAPDGSVWIVDMVRQVIEHPEWIPTAWQERLDLRAGAGLGRIYRVCRQGFELGPSRVPPTAEAVLAGLGDANRAVRDLALLRLVSTPAVSSKIDLDSLREMAISSEGAGARASALGSLVALDKLDSATLAAALDDQDPRLVRLAIEFCERVPELSSDVEAKLARVPERGLGASVDLQWVLTSTQLEGLDSGDGLVLIARRAHDDVWITKALSLVREPRPALSVAQALLDGVESKISMSPAQFALIEQSVARLWEKAEASGRDAWARSELQRMLQGNRDLELRQLLLLTVLANAREKPTAEMSQLMSQVNAQARELLREPSTAEQQRLVLVNLIGCGLASVPSELQLAADLLALEGTGRVSQAVIERLRQLSAPEAAGVLLEAWPKLGSAERSAASATLLSRRDWTARLVDALEVERLHPAELDLATIQRLRSYGDRDLRTRCLAVLGKPTARSEVVARYLAEMPAPSATPRGEELFKRQCAACHDTRDGRSQLGPALENLGHWTIDQWVTAILDPNQSAEPKYQQSLLLTADGQVLAGIVVQRGADELELAMSDGSIKRLPIDEIESVKESTQSLMPEGFEQKLSPEELAELLGYLRAGRQAETR